MLVKSSVCEKNEGDGNGDSILSGFGSSSGSSTDETLEQEEFLDELSRQMAEHMLQEEDGRHNQVANNNKTTLFEPNNVLEHKYGIDKEVKEFQDGSTKAGFHGGAVPNGSALRVLYLGESGSRNGSGGGTGVFIPHATNTTQPDRQLRMKPGRCSRVLIPERVLHCLKQHHEKRNGDDQAHPATMFEARQNEMRLKHQETPNNTLVNNNRNDDNHNDDEELQLPQEWTY